MLGLLATNGQYKNPIIVSVDKDMKTIPCKLIQEDEILHITEKKADRHWFEMSLAGDSGDGMQLTGGRFTETTAVVGNDLSTLPDFPAEIRAPAGSLAGVLAPFKSNLAAKIFIRQEMFLMF